MPCTSSGYEDASPNVVEAETKEIVRLLVYVCEALSEDVPPAYRSILHNKVRGMQYHLDLYTKELCEILTRIEKDPELAAMIIWDGKSVKARKLADWWQAHQEADRKRLADEARARKKKRLRESAIGKLTVEERKALGIK